jgi:hypothetical protein
MIDNYGRDEFALAFSRIEAHYFYNKAWFRSDEQLLEDAHKIRHIPGVIVHGRYDVVCPVDNAFTLKKVWPEADFFVIPDAGHSAFEPGISRASGFRDRSLRALDLAPKSNFSSPSFVNNNASAFGEFAKQDPSTNGFFTCSSIARPIGRAPYIGS